MATTNPGSITFRFSGVCTHFRNGIVPGVPHRVVLSDLTKVEFGALQVIPVLDRSGIAVQEPVLYYTTPHFAQLDLLAGGAAACDQPAEFDLDDDLSGILNIPNVLSNGDIYTGVRLQVINATDLGMTGNFDHIASLRDFFPNYAPSSEVVLNGRARCYLDLFGGCSWVTHPISALPPIVWIRVATDGPPQLLFTPLTSSASPRVITPPADEKRHNNFTMFVKNLEAQDQAGLDSDFYKGAFDYLLHYTTAQGGIPHVLSNRPPGLDPSSFPELPSAGPHNIGESFQIMGNALNPQVHSGRHHRATLQRMPLMPMNSVTPACADSQYP